MKKKLKKTTTQLQSKRPKRKIARGSKMRQLILARLKDLKMTRYDLAKAVKGKVSDQAVYGFLAGRRDMTSGLLWHLIAAVRLKVVPLE